MQFLAILLCVVVIVIIYFHFENSMEEPINNKNTPHSQEGAVMPHLQEGAVMPHLQEGAVMPHLQMPEEGNAITTRYADNSLFDAENQAQHDRYSESQPMIGIGRYSGGADTTGITIDRSRAPIFDTSVDAKAANFGIARARDKRIIDARATYDANYYKWNFGTELDESEARVWWGENEI